MLRITSAARRAARVGALLMPYCGLFACGDGGGAPPGRPNMVWIVANDMSFEVGASGDSVARTPNLDRLAREGVRYTNAFATAGVCAPSRATLITGMYATSIGAQHMRSRQGGYEPGLRPRQVPAPLAMARGVSPHGLGGSVITRDTEASGLRKIETGMFINRANSDR